MHKNAYDFLWSQLKGYDRVRAIYKLRKNINKYGDKSGKKNNILKNILHKDIIGYQFVDLNITRFYPKEQLIYFSNELIKRKHNNLELTKNNNSDSKIIIIDQSSKANDKETLINQEKQRKADSFRSTSEFIIKNKYSKINNDKNIINDNKESENIDSSKKRMPKNKNISKNNKLVQKISNNKTSLNFFNYSRNQSEKSVYNNPPKINDRYIDLANFVQDRESVQSTKTLINNSNINMSLFNKKIIPKIHILKLKTSHKSMKLKKNNLKNNFHAKTRNTLLIKNKNQSELKMRKLKLIKNERSNESFRNIEHGNMTPHNLGQTSNETFTNKGFNTTMTTSLNFYQWKRIPSYIRLPYINKISFPKENTILGKNYMRNMRNNNYFGNYIFLKDNKNQIMNKIYRK